MKKRIISWLITTVMLICMIPSFAFAATAISTVAITGIDAPVVGATPDYTADVSEGVYLDAGNNSALYYKNGIVWWDETDDAYVYTHEAFEEGHEYTLMVYIKADNISNFVFSDGVSVTINGINALVDPQDETFVIAQISFDAIQMQPLPTITYNLNGYELDKNINDVTVTSNSPVTIGEYGTDYFITIGNRIPVMSGMFNDTTTYTLYIAVKSDTHEVSGLTKTNIKLGDKSASNTEVVGNQLFAIFVLPKLEIPTIEINHITIRLDSYPTAGGDLVYPVVHAVNGDDTITDAVKAPVIGGAFGWHEADYFIEDGFYRYIKAPEKFKSGKAYKIFTTLEAADGYEMSDYCYIMLIGPEGISEGLYYNRSKSTVSYEFFFNLGAPTQMPKATDIRVKLTGYEAGKPITGIKVTNTINGKEVPYVLDGPAVSEYAEFYAIIDKDNNLMTSGNFEYGKEYRLVLTIWGDQFDLSKIKPENIHCGLIASDADEFVKTERFIGPTFKLPILKAPISNPFSDVKNGAYYYDSVLWAVQDGITAGITPSSFAPASVCTRAQVVSFLWRAAGSPEPKSTTNPFTDVNSGAYYYKAVLWAVENGITAGVSADSFAPNANCTRGQIVSFLWRANGSQKVTSNNPFSDVKSGAYYYDAVLWAVKNNITAGMTPTSFQPATNCTRGQIVCFLDRFINE